jgi:mRNA interferase HigB
MRVITYRTLREFVESLAGHKDQKAVKAAVDSLYAEVKKANWRTSADVKEFRSRASIVSADRIVFDIKGGGYRLITAVDFEKSIVWIKWIGTHNDYDHIDARKVKYDKRT